ncbi:hypothetical protein FRB94_004940 [Tulasnella sp. JGI-2019a]|nr:hypothetical protein FRB93_001504 [Tulasnella sp. JGI-2019a]KAG9001047.1 hypothetical protein FRB94_004940 [Tulasnella sp. JGI-2019a]KAG9033272.1 hypothetical protein FRB95_000366 [Tulasnella sp. JGI-2019a]
MSLTQTKTTTQSARRRTGSISLSNKPQVETNVGKYVVPNLTINDLLKVIPPHCFERNGWHSALYLLRDIVVLAGLLYAAFNWIPLISPDNLYLPHPALYKAGRFAAWAAYGFVAGVQGIGLFYVGHECGHGAFATSTLANDIVGFFVHSFIALPYFSWKISHRMHHNNTSHLYKDQPHAPYLRSEWELPAHDPKKEAFDGSWVAPDLQEAYREVLEFTPFGSLMTMISQAYGWWWCLLANTESEQNYPAVKKWFPFRDTMFTPKQHTAVMISNVGTIGWVVAVAWSINAFGFLPVVRTYLVPWAVYHHYLVLISYLNHSDPRLPHWETSEFTFARGALSTFDRDLMGGPGTFGKVVNWFAATMSHSFCEVHVVHHVCSKIPHYHAYEAKRHIDALLKEHGINLQGNPVTWAEGIRVATECKFVEDEGGVRFYKNAKGQAALVPVFASGKGKAE